MADCTDGRTSDLQFWRLPTVMAKTGLCRTTIYRRMVEGTFPPNYSYRTGGQARFWRSDEVRAWQAAEVAIQDADDPLRGLIG